MKLYMCWISQQLVTNFTCESFQNKRRRKKIMPDLTNSALHFPVGRTPFSDTKHITFRRQPTPLPQYKSSARREPMLQQSAPVKTTHDSVTVVHEDAKKQNKTKNRRGTKHIQIYIWSHKPCCNTSEVSMLSAAGDWGISETAFVAQNE